MRTCWALAFLALGCSSSDNGDGSDGAAAGGSAGNAASGDFLGSCDTRTVSGPSLGQCRDWIGNSTADLSVSCAGLHGEFSASTPCPEASRVGTCTLEPVLGASAVYGYYSAEYSPQDAEQHCAGLAGTFSAP